MKDWVDTVDRLSASTVCSLGVQLVTAFKALHKRGVIHQDIKPSNILTEADSRNGKFYLIDFGVSVLNQEPLEE
jgi:serine/threonine protein kinase